MRQIDARYGFSRSSEVLNRPRAEFMSGLPGIGVRGFGTCLRIAGEVLDADKENKADSFKNNKSEQSAFWGVLQRDIAVWDIQQVRRKKTEQALTQKERRKLDRRERKLEEVIVGIERGVFERLKDAQNREPVLRRLVSIMEEAQQIGQEYLSTRAAEDNGLNAWGRWLKRSMQRREEANKQTQKTSTYL